MISIIVCSRTRLELTDLEKNINDTIGLPYELIVIENADGAIGLTQAYNEGARQARFSYLCYMHNDVRYETLDWGNRLIAHLQDPATGLIGFSGAIIKSDVPTDASGLFPKRETNFIQHYKHSCASATLIHSSYLKINRAPVVVLDGMWLASRKDVFEHIKFDELNFPGFHGYDIDYCLQVLQRYNIYVVYDILIHHFSEGTYTRQWVESASLISRKWEKELPVSTKNFQKRDSSRVLLKSLKAFLRVLAKTRFGLGFMVGVCAKYSIRKHFHPIVFVCSVFYACRYVLFMEKDMP